MSTTKRHLEVNEWIQELKEGYADGGEWSVPLARHSLRALPDRIAPHVSPGDWLSFFSAAPKEALHSFRFAITGICSAALSDSDLEDILLDHNFINDLFEDSDSFFAHADALRSDLEEDQYRLGIHEIAETPLFPGYATQGTPPKGGNLQIGGEDILLGDYGIRLGKPEETDVVAALISGLEQSRSWDFWRDWYQGFLDGKPLDWELQRRVALIPNEDWEKGPKHIAEKIEEIRQEFRARLASGASDTTDPVTQREKDLIKQHVMANREALALTIASVLTQLADFREKVRGLNHLDPGFREELLDFIDQLSGKLDTLLHELPMPREEIDDVQANRLALWLREFRPLVKQNAAKYAKPSNAAEAVAPTGIILSCTVVGSFFGPAGAGVGALVGGLITNQVKPGKAVDEFLKSSSEDTAMDSSPN